MCVLGGKLGERVGELAAVLELEHDLIAIKPAHPRLDFAALRVGPGAHFIPGKANACEQQKS